MTETPWPVQRQLMDLVKQRWNMHKRTYLRLGQRSGKSTLAAFLAQETNRPALIAGVTKQHVKNYTGNVFNDVGAKWYPYSDATVGEHPDAFVLLEEPEYWPSRSLGIWQVHGSLNTYRDTLAIGTPYYMDSGWNDNVTVSMPTWLVNPNIAMSDLALEDGGWNHYGAATE